MSILPGAMADLVVLAASPLTNMERRQKQSMEDRVRCACYLIIFTLLIRKSIISSNFSLNSSLVSINSKPGAGEL